MPTDTSHNPPDARPLFQLIARTRRLLRSSWVLIGVGLTLGLLFGTLVAMTLFDLFLPLEPKTLPLFPVVVPLDYIARTVALVLIVVPASLAFLHGVIRPLFRRLTATQVARRIESHLPGIHNRLVSAIDLESRKTSSNSSPVFLRRLLTEALARIRNFNPFTVIDTRSLVRATLASAVGLIACVVVGLCFSAYLPTTLTRIFMPWADIPPAADVAYTVQPAWSDILRDGEVTFRADVTHGDPGPLRVDLYGDLGTAPRSFDLTPDRADSSVQRVTVDAASLGKGFENGFRYRVFGGGTWSHEYAIAVVDRPVIDNLTTAVHLPAYMRIPDPIPTLTDSAEVIGPEGLHTPKLDLARVEVTVREQGKQFPSGKTEYSAIEGEIQLLAPSTRRIPVEKQEERTWFDEKLPSGVSPGGTWEWKKQNKQMAHVESSAPGARGHWFQGDPSGQAVGNGDVLFAYVYLTPGELPETVMLEWHDGDGWEHRAFWGSDRMRDGRPGTASRFRVGDLPTSGKWVRLEVPAVKVGLDGKVTQGVAFKLFGGQAAFGRTGLVKVEEPSYRVTRTYPLAKVDENTWTGTFPLTGEGHFRAELRSIAGHANKTITEKKYASVEDRAPYVALDRQNVETVLSKPAALPLSLTAFDDYGIDELTVKYRSTPTAKYETQTIRKFDKPERTATLVSSFEAPAKLKTGEALHYLIEVRDTRGQTMRTSEYLIRIADDANAQDKKLEAFDKTQDTFRDRLVKLIGEQKQVQSGLEKTNKEYAELTKQIRDKEESRTRAMEKSPPEKPQTPDKKPEVQLTPEEAKRLAELRQLLEKLKAEQERNTETSKSISNDLKNEIANADKQDLLPRPLIEEMKRTERLFDRTITDAMRELGSKLADAKTQTPDTKDLRDQGEQIGKNLEGIKNRLDALSDARKGLKEDLEKTLAALRDKMLREDSKMTARDLEQLRDFLNQLKEQMKNTSARADAEAADPSDPADPKRAKKRAETKEDLEALLAKAKKLLDKKSKDRPEFPNAPFRDEKDETVPPREADTNEPLPMKKGDKGSDKSDPKKADKEDEEEEKFMPRLGGKREKLDPRFANKKRPKKEPGSKDDPDEERGDLDAAEKSLDSDANTLEQMIAGLNGKQKPGKNGKPQEGSESEAAAMARQLREMMNSPQTAEARAMAAMARGMAKGQKGKPGQKDRSPPMTSDEGNKDGTPPQGSGELMELSKLDPATKAKILKLPPSRFRDELIQGLGERGPEAYEAFIQDYFKRLTDTKPGAK
jgi:hypothetical protein